MRDAPAFWWREEPGFAAAALQPFGMLYGAITARRMAQRGATLPVPVLCVGNLVAGGAGKTPTALALARMLTAAGHRPAFLSRGYGRSAPRRESRRVIRVDPHRQSAGETGDEPLLLAEAGPTYVCSDRIRAGERATAEGASVLVLDDGLQNPTLAKTIALAVIDAASGIGNGRCVPAGPLRAPLERQWPFVTALCVIGEGRPGDLVASLCGQRRLPVFRARLVPDADAVAGLRSSPLFAFAGIGRPEKFYATLKESGLAVRGQRSFPDHHRFTAAERDALLAAARGTNARLVTTAKDRVRLPPDFPVSVLPVSLVFDEPAAMGAFLTTRLGHVTSPAEEGRTG